MKRFFVLLTVLLMLLSVFSACSKEEVKKPAVIVSQTEQFTIRRVDGRCYLDLGSQNARENWGGGCLPPDKILFHSVDEMYRTLMTGAFDETDIWGIRCTFSLDEELGFRIVDPERFYVPMLPAGNEVKRIWMGSGWIWYQTSCGNFTVLTKEGYESEKDDLRRFTLNKGSYKNLTKRVEDDREVYEYWDWDRGDLLHRVTQYHIQTDEKAFYVEYEYIEPDNEPEPLIYGEGKFRFCIVGCHNGVYFKMEGSNLEVPPSTEWIMLLGAKAYVPK